METESSIEKPSTRAVGLRFGLYYALAGVLLFAIAVAMSTNPFKGWTTWATYPIAIGLMVYAHKQFKEGGDGYMEYGQGVGIGFWMGVASTLSIPFLYVYLNYVDSAPFELFLQQQEDEMISKGTPDNIVETSITWTRKLFWVIALFGGVIGFTIYGLIVSIFTKKSNPEMPI
jgi:high-affinity Fe2+/Pb2+ permease